jgi:hypothetical protein
LTHGGKSSIAEEGAMTPYAKATAVGAIAGLLTPVVVVGIIMVAFTGIAATGGGGIAGVSAGIAESLLFLTPLLLAVAGFVAGFAWTLRRARRHGHS